MSTELKLTYIDGLKDIVLKELKQYGNFTIHKADKEELYMDVVSNFKTLRKLKSVSKISLVTSDEKFHPIYLFNNKSVIGNLIETVLKKSSDTFRTFKILCAGSDSKEIRRIAEYIEQNFKLTQAEDADLKIHIIKPGEMWEVGVQLFRRPLSMREYKVENVKGGINPTIAYVMNTLAEVKNASSYLNICSGSATLLIEAAQVNPDLKLVGFDIDKKHISLAIQNVKKAGLIKSIQLKEADIFDAPDLGKFDVITADLPFGMLVSKDADLEKLYRAFVEYCEHALHSDGKLVVYTTEDEILRKILLKSKFEILQTLDLKIVSSVNAYMYPKVFVCGLK